MPLNQPRAQIQAVLSQQRFGVLSTVNNNAPHCSLVAFAETDDLTQIIFATSIHTQKYANLGENPRISLFVDTRTNLAEDVSSAVTVEAIGRPIVGKKLDSAKLELYRTRYLSKLPFMADFLKAKDTEIVVIAVSEYQLVSDFQKVQKMAIN